VRFTPDGKYLFCAESGNVWIFDPEAFEKR
jgi:hypothetical protein